jgi:hypothetical protein
VPAVLVYVLPDEVPAVTRRTPKARPQPEARPPVGQPGSPDPPPTPADDPDRMTKSGRLHLHEIEQALKKTDTEP